MDKEVNNLVNKLIKHDGVQTFKSREPYEEGYDVEITKVYAKENRHLKMPDKYTVIIVPAEEEY